jgi:hypothetical protein
MKHTRQRKSRLWPDMTTGMDMQTTIFRVGRWVLLSSELRDFVVMRVCHAEIAG